MTNKKGPGLTYPRDAQMELYSNQNTKYLRRLKNDLETQQIENDTIRKISYILEQKEKGEEVLMCQGTCGGECGPNCKNNK